jgi:hypothetical protein
MAWAKYDGVGEMHRSAPKAGHRFYPAMDEEGPPKARAFAAERLLAGPILSFLEARYTLSQDRPGAYHEGTRPRF